MRACEVLKSGKKWVVVLKDDGTIAFTGKTRVSCFRWCYENNLEIVCYQHGGN